MLKRDFTILPLLWSLEKHNKPNIITEFLKQFRCKNGIYMIHSSCFISSALKYSKGTSSNENVKHSQLKESLW